MKRFSALLVCFLITALALFGCSSSEYTDDLNASKINPSQSVLKKYPGLSGEYYADGDSEKTAMNKLINEVVPDILKKEITEKDGIEVIVLEVAGSDITDYDEGDVAQLNINATLNNGDPMERKVLVFITSEQTEKGWRCYFLNYHNMDQNDQVTDEEKQKMLDDTLAQITISDLSTTQSGESSSDTSDSSSKTSSEATSSGE